jgi:hypothetical protein
MSEVTIFIIGAVIFAITVYGSVMAGGLALTRLEAEENDSAGGGAATTSAASVGTVEDHSAA